MASFYDYARRYDEAIVQHQKALELDPNFWIAYSSLGLSYLQKSLNKEAIAEAERTVALSPNNRLAVTRSDIGFNDFKHGFLAGLSLRAGGGGPAGQHMIVNMDACSCYRRWRTRTSWWRAYSISWLLRYRYGQKRERIDENQLFLFAAQLIAASLQTTSMPSGEEPAANSPSASDGKEKAEKPERRGHGRKPLSKSLERRRVVFELEESQRQCQHCHIPMQKIGEDVSERLEFIPASLQVIEEVCPKYACAKGCGVAAAPKPSAPIEKGLPGPGLLAHVAVSKYGDHLPLNRLESIFQRHGVELSRKTMCDWMAACAELVSPVWERMKEIVLTSKAMQTDDTPVPVLDRQLTRTRTGRIWTYVGDRNGPYIVYDYTGNRSREGPEEFLRGCNGFLQADAYAAYDAMFTNPKAVLDRDCLLGACKAIFF